MIFDKLRGGFLLFIRFLRYLRGHVKFFARSGSFERLINLCAHHRVPLWDCRREEAGYSGRTTVDGYRRMLSDDNFSQKELSAIAYGYTRLLQESTHALQDLKEIINPTEMSMTDKDRLDVIERIYAELLRCRSLTAYYTRKNISVSLLRSREKDNTERIMTLYGGSEGEKYW